MYLFSNQPSMAYPSYRHHRLRPTTAKHISGRLFPVCALSAEPAGATGQGSAAPLLRHSPRQGQYRCRRRRGAGSGSSPPNAKQQLQKARRRAAEAPDGCMYGHYGAIHKPTLVDRHGWNNADESHAPNGRAADGPFSIGTLYASRTARQYL